MEALVYGYPAVYFFGIAIKMKTIRGVRPVFNIWQRLTPRRVPSVVGFISGLEILFLNWLLLNLTPTGFAPWIQCHLLNVLFLGI